MQQTSKYFNAFQEDVVLWKSIGKLLKKCIIWNLSDYRTSNQLLKVKLKVGILIV